jgi:putative membrane protein
MPDTPTYRARTIAFLAAFAVVGFAVLGPLDGAAERRLSWHMVQHLLLISVAAPLLALGRPVALAIDLFPRLGRLRRLQVDDNLASAGGGLLMLIVLFGWHIPALYDLALRHEPVHALEHASLIVSAMLLWSALIHARRLGAGVLWLYVITLPMTGLGVAMTIVRSPWYPAYVHGSRAAAVRDQQMAGVIMWAFGGLAAVVSAVALFAVWLAHAGAAVPPAEVRSAS